TRTELPRVAITSRRQSAVAVHHASGSCSCRTPSRRLVNFCDEESSTAPCGPTASTRTLCVPRSIPSQACSLTPPPRGPPIRRGRSPLLPRSDGSALHTPHAPQQTAQRYPTSRDTCAFRPRDSQVRRQFSIQAERPRAHQGRSRRGALPALPSHLRSSGTTVCCVRHHHKHVPRARSLLRSPGTLESQTSALH